MRSAADVLETLPQGVDTSPPQAALPLMPGQIVDDKYAVERILGVGGMGVVVAAMHLELGERVAIKAMLPEAAAGRDTGARFSREAQAVARIKSEFVVHVLDVGKLEGGTPYMVMEYLEGETLACCLEREGRLPVEIAVDTLLEACVALAEAHRLGIVHRDVKPTNLFLARDASGHELVKVIDFGIAKNEGQVGLTRTAAPMGTPGYMSPEQLRSAGSVRATADIWSLGVVLFEMSTGTLPFEVTSFADFCARVLVSPPVAPRLVVPTLPEALEHVILRCLRRDPAERYPSVGELARALAPFATDGGRALVTRIELLEAGPSSAGSRAAAPPSSGRRAPALPRATPATLSASRAPSAARTRVEDGNSSRDAAATPVAWRTLIDDTSLAFGAPLRRRPHLLVGGALLGVLALGAWLVARPVAATDAAPPIRPAPALESNASMAAAREVSPASAAVPLVTPSTPPPVAVVAPAAARPTSRAPVPTASPRAGPGRGPAPGPRSAPPSRFENFGGRK